jgi:hypothetical protein
MSEQLQKKRPVSGGTGTDIDEVKVVDGGDTSAIQKALKDAADAERKALIKKRADDALEAAQTAARKRRRAPCCCC